MTQPKMTHAELANLLSVETHRKAWPVVRWIENKMHAGDTDYGDSLPEVVDCVRITDGGYSGISYTVDSETGMVNSVIPNGAFHEITAEASQPTEEEIELLSVIYPDLFERLCFFCGKWKTNLFDKPHTSDIQYVIKKRRVPRMWQTWGSELPRC